MAELADYCLVEAEGVGSYVQGGPCAEELVRAASARVGVSAAQGLRSLLRRGERFFFADLLTPPYRERTFERVLLRALGDVGYRWVFAAVIEHQTLPIGRMFLLGSRAPFGSGQLAVAHELAAQLSDALAREARPSGIRRKVDGRVERLFVLADASRELGASLDSRAAIARLAELLVPALADGCAFDLLDDDGAIRRAVTSHASPEKARLFARDADERVPLHAADAHPIARAIRSGTSLIAAEVPSSDLDRVLHRSGGQAGERAAAGSYLILPMRANGRALGAITLFNEESGRRFDEDDRAFGEDLASRASLAIDNARLYELAKRAAHDQDELVTTVSHDLKNLLAALGISAVALKRSLDEAPQAEAAKRAVEVVRRSVARMQRLVHELLDLRRMEAGRLLLVPQPCDAQSLVRDACDLLGAIAAQKNVTLEVMVDPALGPVMCDAGRVFQVISNLLDNALKFTKESSRVEVSLTRESRGFVRISVADQGPGISACDLPRVFDRHWQAEGAPQSGYGIGLAIAKGIIDAHGARIWAESVVGGGTTFVFTLPLVDDAT